MYINRYVLYTTRFRIVSVVGDTSKVVSGPDKMLPYTLGRYDIRTANAHQPGTGDRKYLPLTQRCRGCMPVITYG